ncbi:hypothetical protein DPEC_G00102010 [Dallia pectoralis]|uniref:Uncharacterized protein n=1 Tax=Dallia pectoralis TaxID=75939 RepID=A0ACC2GXE8_DALPE|nr:hypothetical protein DPEC_G00102010 [Dallia pectoralis]
MCPSVMVSVRLCVALLLLCACRRTRGGKVLVFPGEYSHWLNMRVVVEELVERNHSVTVMVCSASPSVKYTKPEGFSFMVYNVPFEKHEWESLTDDFLSYWMYEALNASTLQVGLKIHEVFGRMTALQLQMCDSLFHNSELMDNLRRLKFDAVLSDPMIPCTDLLADILNVPLIVSLRFSFGMAMERHCGQIPAPPSYVPSPPLMYTDQMSFFERVHNFITYMIQSFIFYLHCLLTLDKYYSKIKGEPTTFCETMGKADIWLIRTYWDLEYPRPFLPNFKFVGGLHCKPAKPLPDAIEEFVQSSGDDGIVVLSLGSMVKNLTKDRGNKIATALGQIPQKVLWRYNGEKPETLAPNTRVYNWIPQNDLLGHPKTKAFITHGGTNGLYEAIYHGVPLVGVPLFGDQYNNIFQIINKGAATLVDFNKMTSEDLLDALNGVINNSSYKENMMKLSRIHHDQPESPLETAVFWVEFVMRNKGAKHLRVQAHNLSWYQYHCLDVAAALFVVLLLVIVVCVKMGTICFRKCCKRTQARLKTE